MQVDFNQSDLAAALNIVSRALPGKTNNDILNGIYIDAQDKVTIRATDYEIDIQYTLNAEIIDPGKVLVPGKLFCSIVKAMGGRVTIKTTDTTLTIRSGSAQYNIAIMPLINYPDVKAIDVQNSITIPGEVLLAVQNQVVFAAGKSAGRPLLTGIQFLFLPGEIVVNASDSRRAAQKRIRCDHDMEGSVIVPPRPISELSKVIADNIRIGWSAKDIIFETEELTIRSRVLEGNYPDIERVMPKEADVSATVPKKALLDALGRISMVSVETIGKDTFDSVKMTFKPNVLQLRGENMTGSATEEVPIELDGEELYTAFNGSFISEGLRAISGDSVRWGLSSKLKPGMMTAPNDQGYKYVVAPLNPGKGRD